MSFFFLQIIAIYFQRIHVYFSIYRYWYFYYYDPGKSFKSSKKSFHFKNDRAVKKWRKRTKEILKLNKTCNRSYTLWMSSYNWWFRTFQCEYYLFHIIIFEFICLLISEHLCTFNFIENISKDFQMNCYAD